MEYLWGWRHAVAIMAVCLVLRSKGTEGIRFWLENEESCFSHEVKYEGDAFHMSFVVIQADSGWHHHADGVDLVIKGPAGEQIQDFRDTTSAKFDYVAPRKGLYHFCFTNKSPYYEALDFDVQLGHSTHSDHDQHVKDDHLSPLLEHIAKLDEALVRIQFEQHWLKAQTDRQAIVNGGMSRRAVHKAVLESAALVGASVLQVYLLQRLFERKRGTFLG